MLVGRRFRVRFTPDQLAYADQVAGVCRAVWNSGLDQRRQYRQRRSWINYAQQCHELAEAKLDPEFAWLKQMPGHCLQQTLKDLDMACRRHGTWKVRFRSKARWSPSFRFPEGKPMRVLRLSKRWAQINLPKFGQVRYRFTRDLGGVIRSASLIRDGVHGDWYVSILVDDGIRQGSPDLALPAIGIDRGVAVALALSDGRMLDQNGTSTCEQVAIARLQRKAARQHGPRIPGTKGKNGLRAPSKRWLRTHARIARKLAAQRRRRDDFMAKTANALTHTHSLIAVEDLRIKSMTKKATSKPDPDNPGSYLANGRRRSPG